MADITLNIASLLKHSIFPIGSAQEKHNKGNASETQSKKLWKINVFKIINKKQTIKEE